MIESFHTMTEPSTGIDEPPASMNERIRTLRSRYVDRPMVATRDYVKENPGKTLLFTVAAGFLLGTLLLRRR